MSSKRDRVGRYALTLGVTQALEALPRFPSITVINYHRIGDSSACPFDRGIMEATPEEFDAQMACLKHRFHVTDLEEVNSMVDRRKPLRHSHVLVTFDDGYRDNHDVALPILQRHGIRATFFLSTAFVGQLSVPWWDQIAFMVRHTEERRLRLSYPSDVVIDLHSQHVDAAIVRLLKIYKHPKTDNTRLLTEIESATQVPRPVVASDRQFLSWSEAAAILRAGMHVGSHAHRHEMLSKLDADDQRRECVESRQILRQQLGITVDSLSYPVGSRRSFSETTKTALADAGYRSAFSYYGGVNTGRLDRFDILRMPVDPMPLGLYRLRMAIAGGLGRQVW